MSSRLSQIKHILTSRYSDLFESNTLSTLKIKQDTTGEQIWAPEPLPIDDVSGGIPLRDGVGFIRIQERFKNGGVVSYIYKFTSNEYIFTTERTGASQLRDECRIFDFHYDKEENDMPHGPHVNVVFPSLRHMSTQIKLEDFLSFVRDHFFEVSSGKLVKRNNPIWVNRI
jgi:hypothetical protein